MPCVLSKPIYEPYDFAYEADDSDDESLIADSEQDEIDIINSTASICSVCGCYHTEYDPCGTECARDDEEELDYDYNIYERVPIKQGPLDKKTDIYCNYMCEKHDLSRNNFYELYIECEDITNCNL